LEGEGEDSGAEGRFEFGFEVTGVETGELDFAFVVGGDSVGETSPVKVQ
jgi:hypothetical protein